MKYLKWMILGVALIIVVIVFLIIWPPMKNTFFSMYANMKPQNIDQTWAGHSFRVATVGDVELLENGYIIYDDSEAIPTMTDINFNQKIKVRIVADLEGSFDSESPENPTKFSERFTEFAIYLEDSEKRAGLALIGTRDNIYSPNIRKTFHFTEFTLENTGTEIIFSDSSGRRVVNTKDDDEAIRTNSPFDLNPDEEWYMRINAHVNGEGYAKLDIKSIEIL